MRTRVSSSRSELVAIYEACWIHHCVLIRNRRPAEQRTNRSQAGASMLPLNCRWQRMNQTHNRTIMWINVHNPVRLEQGFLWCKAELIHDARRSVDSCRLELWSSFLISSSCRVATLMRILIVFSFCTQRPKKLCCRHSELTLLAEANECKCPADTSQFTTDAVRIAVCFV